MNCDEWIGRDMRRASVEKAIGCATIFPAALIGLSDLTDGVGPTGWWGLSELIGWVGLCAAASLAIALILAQVRYSRLATCVAVVVAMALAAGLALLMNWLGLRAPMSAKMAFTSSLQVIGTIASAALVVWLAYLSWTRTQRS